MFRSGSILIFVAAASSWSVNALAQNSQMSQPAAMPVVVQAGLRTFTIEKPPDGWKNSDFDDSAWQQGPGAFGKGESDWPVRTPWTGKEIWLRRAVEANASNALVSIHLHDKVILGRGGGIRVIIWDEQDVAVDFSDLHRGNNPPSARNRKFCYAKYDFI